MNFILRVLTVGFSILAASLLLLASPASAHTDFQSSEPIDGATTDEAVGEIVIRFSGEADPAGDGFVVLDPSGSARAPDSIAPNAEKTAWKLSFDPPLTAGTVGVRWTVQAPDTHPIDGSFSFTVDPIEVTSSGPESNADGDAISSEAIATPTQPDRADGGGAFADEPGADQELAAFLSQRTANVAGADGAGTFGRLLGFMGTMLAIGGSVFATYVIRDRRPDIVAVLKVVRYAALVVVVGTAIDLTAHLAIAGGGWKSAWSDPALDSVAVSAFGSAVWLRICAGVLLFVATRRKARNLPLYAVAAVPEVALSRERFTDHAEAGPSSSGLGLMAEPIVVEERTAGAPISPTVVVSVLLLLASFTFDGHTVTAGNRWVTGSVDMIHVVAGSIWAGGVVAFAVVLWRRHRHNQRLNALELAIRFSVPAGVALAAAGVAGTVLAAIILDEIAALWTTPWGRLLIVKFVAVVTAGSVGTYNHFILIPWLRRHPGDDTRSMKLRNTVTTEALLLVVVLAVTALLVGAASS